MSSFKDSLDLALRNRPVPLDQFAVLDDDEQQLLTRVRSVVGGIEMLTDELARVRCRNDVVDARTDALVDTLSFVSPAALEGLTGASC
jgi:hypothetical protein